MLQSSEGRWNGIGVYLHINKYIKEVERANACRIISGEKKTVLFQENAGLN